MISRIADGRTDLVFEWIAGGNFASAVDEAGVPLIQTCAYYGDVSAVRFLLLHGAPLAALGENLGLAGAAFHGHWQLCQFLIESGADARLADGDTGETALHAALSKPWPVLRLVAQVLLAAGADPNAVTKAGVETGCFMRDCRTKGETPLHRAAAFASGETIQLLLDHGADREARDANGDTPLGWASWYGRDDGVLRKLLHGEYRIRAGRESMEAYLKGKPHV